ncbi:YozQ family protein [Bacillus norwichensis]|uniref:YozQ family protein n=1 Tax=Bacillus norwichensis TaxID=2762217 RepID=A0ABR8VRW9_9BACI|nr:YozQ family protein [Bacillus norwichensis]MBD8007286.1 YozQ family protein [Bacillus norwichensis]
MDKNHEKSLELAGRKYELDDSHEKDSISKALAITHEQVSDAYIEGQIDPVIEEENGKDT